MVVAKRTKQLYGGENQSALGLRIAASAAILSALLMTSACRIQEDKGNGDSKADHVKISTPLGGMNVRTNDIDASSLGLPEYPGAHLIAKGENGDKDGSVDLHMGFGPWQMRVKVANYSTDDSQDKVLAFYRQGLAKYGDVVECEGHKPVGAPAVTKEGLGCDEHDSGVHADWNQGGSAVHIDDNNLELKSGSKRRQRIVGFKTAATGTKFALVYLELPGSNADQTN